jgi:peptidyl-tRNA hydrolase
MDRQTRIRNMKGERKQVIVLRKDLGMRKGKMVAQGAHASLARR